jgi:hypothetical protein
MCELLVNDTEGKYDLKLIGAKEMKLLALNIFPNFKTVLHHCFDRLDVVRKLYRMAEKTR